MERLCGKLCCLCAALVITGCLSPENVRTPDILRGQLPTEHASKQRRDFEIHDPLPSEDIGPATNTRPRAFRIQRAQPRRALENIPRNSLLPNNATDSTYPPTGFPGTVNPN